jgi:hypothetical protein
MIIPAHDPEAAARVTQFRPDVAVLGLEGKRRHQVGFGGKQMNWGARGMRANTSHFEMSFGEASCA